MSAELEPAKTSVVTIKIGNKEYPAVLNPRCGVCTHPARWEIEAKLLQGYTRPFITRWISEHNQTLDDGTVKEWPTISVMQLKHHMDVGHCPANAQVITQLAERRANELGIDMESGYTQIVDSQIAARMILQQGVENLVTGKASVDTKDTLAAAKLLTEIENLNKTEISKEMYDELFVIYFSAVQSIVSKDQMVEILTVIQDHPVYQEFKSRQKTVQATEGS